MKSIFVGNIPFEANEDEIRSLFEPYGSVSRVYLPVDRESNRPRGFGFVEMSDDQEALAAIDGVNGAECGGRTLRVNEARPREARGGGGGGGRGRY